MFVGQMKGLRTEHLRVVAIEGFHVEAADRPVVQTLQIQEVVTCLHSIAQFSHHLHPASFPRYILATTRPSDLSKC